MSRWPKSFKPNEPEPRDWEPMRLVESPEHGKTVWENKYYSTTAAVKPDGSCVRLMITNADQSARRDWREFQRIKNQICGDDWVGYEIYPPEDQAVDPSNAFFLWCFPKVMLPPDCGMCGPRHFTPEQAIAPQRGGEK